MTYEHSSASLLKEVRKIQLEAAKKTVSKRKLADLVTNLAVVVEQLLLLPLFAERILPRPALAPKVPWPALSDAVTAGFSPPDQCVGLRDFDQAVTEFTKYLLAGKEVVLKLPNEIDLQTEKVPVWLKLSRLPWATTHGPKCTEYSVEAYVDFNGVKFYNTVTVLADDERLTLEPRVFIHSVVTELYLNVEGLVMDTGDSIDDN